jgi:hypothetical protein
MIKFVVESKFYNIKQVLFKYISVLFFFSNIIFFLDIIEICPCMHCPFQHIFITFSKQLLYSVTFLILFFI